MPDLYHISYQHWLCQWSVCHCSASGQVIVTLSPATGYYPNQSTLWIQIKTAPILEALWCKSNICSLEIKAKSTPVQMIQMINVGENHQILNSNCLNQKKVGQLWKAFEGKGSLQSLQSRHGMLCFTLNRMVMVIIWMIILFWDISAISYSFWITINWQIKNFSSWKTKVSSGAFSATPNDVNSCCGQREVGPQLIKIKTQFKTSCFNLSTQWAASWLN